VEAPVKGRRYGDLKRRDGIGERMRDDAGRERECIPYVCVMY
jgi:hypothetical protein